MCVLAGCGTCPQVTVLWKLRAQEGHKFETQSETDSENKTEK